MGAPPTPPEPPPRTIPEHRGFFLRVAVGLSILGAGQETDAGITTTLGGLGTGYSVWIGAAVAKNFVLHGAFFGSFIFHPTVERMREDTYEGVVRYGGLGAGATVYFMPINFFVSGVIGAGTTSAAEIEGRAFDADWGPALNLMVGKEWLLSKSLGLGVAVQGMIMVLDDDPDVINVLGIGPTISVTIN
jgi:hypothetical protein